MSQRTMAYLFNNFVSKSENFVPFGFFAVVCWTLLKDPNGGLENTLWNFVMIVALKTWIFYEQINSNFIVSKPTVVFLLGVAFSWVGGAYFDHFAYRMVAFALAHFCYISVFGWKLAQLEIVICLCIYIYIGPMVANDDVLPLHIAAFMGMYVVVLLIMCCRSLARASHRKEMLSSVGSEFAMFDAMIIINMFLPDHALWILFIYCLTELAITLKYRRRLFIKYSDRYRILT